MKILTSLELASILALVASSGVGCSSGSGGASQGAAPPDDTGAIADDTGGPASDDANGGDDAAPPCGTHVGDVLCDVQVQGYSSIATTGLASTQPVTTFNVSDVLAQGTQPYAFIFGTSFW